MHTNQFENKELLKALTEELTFSRFLELKSMWLQNICNEWLIMGHLTEQEAREIVRLTELELKYKPIDPSQIPLNRLVQLPALSVSEYEEKNYDPSNPNSAVMCIF
jgi:secreted Zn-dependent insulinase-like peptidase